MLFRKHTKNFPEALMEEIEPVNLGEYEFNNRKNAALFLKKIE